MENCAIKDSPAPASIARLEEALLRQSRLLAALSDDARKNHSAITALIALAQALVESHPYPAALAKNFLDQIDKVGSAVSSEHAERYRADLQQINSYILDVVNRRPSQ